MRATTMGCGPLKCGGCDRAMVHRLTTGITGLMLGSMLAAPSLTGQTVELNSRMHPETGLRFGYPESFSVLDSATLPRLLAREDLSQQNREALVYVSEHGFQSTEIQLIDLDHPAGIFLEIADRSADSLSTERRVEVFVRHEQDVEGAEVATDRIQVGPDRLRAQRVIRFSTLSPVRGIRVFVQLGGRDLVVRFRDDPRLGELARERELAFQSVLNTLTVSR